MQKIYKKLPEITLTIQEYPNLDLDGKDSKRINPALELVKSVCKVFKYIRYIISIILKNK